VRRLAGTLGFAVGTSKRREKSKQERAGDFVSTELTRKRRKPLQSSGCFCAGKGESLCGQRSCIDRLDVVPTKIYLVETLVRHLRIIIIKIKKKLKILKLEFYYFIFWNGRAS
jgi:hypothetical protein